MLCKFLLDKNQGALVFRLKYQRMRFALIQCSICLHSPLLVVISPCKLIAYYQEIELICVSESSFNFAQYY